MKDKESGQSRRKLLTAAGLGAVAGAGKMIPGQWTRPVVETMVLPAHAAVSPGPCDCSDTYCFQGLVVAINDGIVQLSVAGGPSSTTSCGADGSFSLAFAEVDWFEGTIADDCSSVSLGVCPLEDAPCNGDFTASFVATPEGC